MSLEPTNGPTYFGTLQLEERINFSTAHPSLQSLQEPIWFSGPLYEWNHDHCCFYYALLSAPEDPDKPRREVFATTLHGDRPERLSALITTNGEGDDPWYHLGGFKIHTGSNEGHAIVHQRYRPSATAHHHYAWTHETHPELSTQTQNLMRMIRTPFSINTETVYANPEELQEAWQDLITKEKPEAKGHKMHFIVSYDAHILSTARRET